jgi:uncharacterized protein YcbK (DUF882 family)
MRYFTRYEFACRQTGENKIRQDFLEDMDELRHACGFPFTITSGYRSPMHSKEAAKDKPGQHSEGWAADVRVADGVQRMAVVRNAIELGFTGIGVAKTFVHVDMRVGQPVMWTY